MLGKSCRREQRLIPETWVFYPSLQERWSEERGLCFLRYCCHSLSLSRSLIFSPSLFPPSLSLPIWREGGGGEEERRRVERTPCRQQYSQIARKGVCVCMHVYVCVRRVVVWERKEIEDARVQMRGKYQPVLMLHPRRRVVTVELGVRVTADWTTPVTARGQRLSREHLFTLHQTVGKY